MLELQTHSDSHYVMVAAGHHERRHHLFRNGGECFGNVAFGRRRGDRPSDVTETVAREVSLILCDPGIEGESPARVVDGALAVGSIAT